MKILTKYSFIIVFLLAFVLRFVNLGYSDYQGDEYKAFFMPDKEQGLVSYLLDQRKGPLQFVITFGIKQFDPYYQNQYLVRLPFALAGFLAVIFFYKFVELYFGKKVAFYASFFFATNGFLIAFSRIVQYQSYVILFMILALYFFSLSIFRVRFRISGIYLGFIFWAISILAHYDGVFIFPFVAYILYKWIKMSTNYTIGRKLAHLFAGGLIFGLMLSVFYIPFIFAITDSTRDYWSNRLSGGTEKISSSIYLFRVYQPIYVIHVYFILFSLGLIRYIFLFISPLLHESAHKSISKKATNVLYALKKRVFSRMTALMFWVFVPWFFMEVIVNIPGTHIFTYLIPAMIFLGFGVVMIENIVTLIISRLKLKNFYAQFIYLFGIFIVFTFVFLQSYAVFVSNKSEYPWENEKFLIWEFNRPTPIFHLSMFGFPYYRHWEEIGSFVRTSQNNGYYSTNERDSISRNLIPFDKDTDNAGHFVYIKNPQSFTEKPTQDKAIYWIENNDPVKIFYKRTCRTDFKITCYQTTQPVAEIYYMPTGDLESIKTSSE